ncbi:MAG: hypothetical protein CMO73_09905 [Verrucomicrobiales bacterium]|nr:hypothetical protein [Verrucomicrobiales bacterium]
MFRQKTGIGLIVLALLGTAGAEMADKGLVIRNTDGLIFIDLGREDGVIQGDLFDIIDQEVVLHPLSGDTLSVTPQSVGALKVLQIYPKMSLVQLLHIQGNRDPMLMRVAQIQDPGRLVEIDQFLAKNYALNSGPSLRLSLLPGLYQYHTGKRAKGLSLMGLEIAALSLGVSYRISSDDWFAKYESLGPDLTQKEYDFYFEGASDRRTSSNRFFWLAGALYAYNLVDVMWMGGDGVSSVAQTDNKLDIGLGFAASGYPLLNIMHRF